MAGKETVKGHFGNEPIELNNAATETTLFALLRLAQKDSAVLAEMAKKAGIDSKKIQESLDKQGDGGGGGSKGGGLGLLGTAANLAGGFLMDMVGGITKTIGNLAAFANQLMDGTARASDFFKAFKDLPLGLGLFAELLAFAQKFMEKQIDTYRTISQTGAGLTSSLGGLRVQALNLGLSMDEFAGMFATNQAALSSLGGSASAGAKNLVAINNSLINSKMGGTLMGLGYSFSQINGLIGDYIATTGDGLKVGKDVTSEQTRLAKAAGAYGKELDFLSRLTGESREAIQKKMEADAQEASWKMYLAGLPEEQQALAAQAVERARMMGGKGGVDAIKAMFMGFAGPFTAEGQTFISTMGGGTKALQDMVGAVKNNKDATKTLSQLDNLFAKGMISNIKDIEKFRTNIMAMGQGADGGAKALLEITEATNVYKRKGMDDVKAIEQAIKDARTKQANDAAATEAQAKVDLAMKRLGAQLTLALLPLLESLNKIGIELIGKFSKLVARHLPDIQDALEKLATWILKAFEHPDKAINDIKAMFKELLAGMLELATQSWWGKRLFGEDAAAKMQNSALIDKGKAIVREDFIKLEAAVKSGKATDQQKAEFEAQSRILMEAGQALARKEAAGNWKEFNRTDPAIVDQATTAAMAAYEKKYPGGWAVANNQAKTIAIEQQLGNLQTQWEKNTAREAENLRTNKLSGVEIMDAINRTNMLVGVAEKRATGSPGGRVEDWGKESLVKLHGKEAVLTEDQLAAMQNKSNGSNTTIELSDLKIVAEGIITLNRATAMQNKILATMVENQRTMINRATGNRLMA